MKSLLIKKEYDGEIVKYLDKFLENGLEFSVIFIRDESPLFFVKKITKTIDKIN